jgi:hypothetical protein
MKRGDILIGVGAGLVSAVLFATLISGSLAGILLFYLTPLPVAIVSLGWNHRSGLVASAVGAIAVGLVFDPQSGLMFAFAFALPVWWLAFLALLARPGVGGGGATSAPAVTRWYPLGSLSLWAGGMSVLLTLAGALMLGADYEGYHSTVEKLVEGAFNGGLAEEIDGLRSIGENGLSIKDIARFVASIVVPMSAAASTLLTLVIMLVAAKLVALSGRLPRPLPQMARAFVLPRATLLGLVASFAIAPFSGWPRFVALALAATIAMLLAMQGLATAHVLVWRVAARPLILGMGYAMIVVAEPWMAAALAMLGLAELVFSLRARSLASAPSGRRE